MAVMVPAQVGVKTDSKAEKRVFRAALEQMPNEWLFLHSLGLTIHSRKPWAEIDFVAVGPEGIFCLEVKGGGVARHGGIWTTTDAAGLTHNLKESPFAQVGSAAAALTKFLRENGTNLNSTVVGYGVVFPDIRFDVTGPDIEEKIVCDAEGVGGFKAYMRRLSEYWGHRAASEWGRSLLLLKTAEIRNIRDRLAKDFDLLPSLRMTVGSVNDQLVRLTQEQRRTLDGLSENPRVVIQGGAGSGKTLLAITESQRLAKQGARVLFTCFSRNLAKHVGKVLEGTPHIRVRHFHGLMADIVSEAGLQHKLPDAQPEDLFTVFYPELSIEALLARASPPFDFIVVDEAQDLLLPSYLDVFDVLLGGGLDKGGWRIFSDPNQNIFEATSQEALPRLNRANPSRFRLSLNCRNTTAVATAVSMMSGVPLSEVLAAEGPNVETIWYRDSEDQRRKISAAVRELLFNGLRSCEITILSKRQLDRSCLKEGLISSPAPLLDISEAHGNARAIRFATVAAYKGLESDAVLLADVDDLQQPLGLNSVYVGASRAKAILRVYIKESQIAAYQDLAFHFGCSQQLNGG